MSLTSNTTLQCPTCEAPIDAQLWDSINADRRPDLRQAVLDRGLHRFTCGSCGTSTRVPPSLVYLDMGRNQVILANPASELGDWKGAVADARNALARGLSALTESNTTTRVVFGWAALREQLIIAAAGLDSVDVEVVKLALMRTSPDLLLDDAFELRLVNVDGEVWHLAWLHADTEVPEDFLEVGPDARAGIAPQAPAWASVREQLSEELFVDATRLLMA